MADYTSALAAIFWCKPPSSLPCIFLVLCEFVYYSSATSPSCTVQNLSVKIVSLYHSDNELTLGSRNNNGLSFFSSMSFT
jgi:hypothetical protein